MDVRGTLQPVMLLSKELRHYAPPQTRQETTKSQSYEDQYSADEIEARIPQSPTHPGCEDRSPEGTRRQVDLGGSEVARG
jgi:hypothetical protein